MNSPEAFKRYRQLCVLQATQAQIILLIRRSPPQAFGPDSLAVAPVTFVRDADGKHAHEHYSPNLRQACQADDGGAQNKQLYNKVAKRVLNADAFFNLFCYVRPRL